MPQPVVFNNKQIIEPGAYSQIIGAAPAAAAIDTFGNVMLIDTGLGKDFVGRSGIIGTVDNGGDSVYVINSLQEGQQLMRGGILYDLMSYLFSPALSGNGPRIVYFSRAAITVAAGVTLTFSNGHSVNLITRHEGTVGNGVLTTGVLTRGFAVKLMSGVLDTTKFVLATYAGQFKGLDANGIPYENSEATLAANNLVTKLGNSKEISTFVDLLNYFKNDTIFNQDFKFVSASDSTDFNLSAADITLLSSYQLFTGGTTQYASARVDDVLANVVDLDFDQFLCTDFGGIPNPIPTGQQILDGINLGAMSVNNAKILAYMSVQSLYTLKSMYVGGGNDSNKFDVSGGSADGSIQIAAYYNSALVQVVHSGPRIINNAGALVDIPLSIYTAAMVCGRVAGLEPQVPVTYKDIRVSGMVHVLSQPQREKALLYGVLHIKNIPKLGWVVNQGIDTLQDNSSDIYPNGTSPSIQVMRIFHQLNKELVINAAARFPGGNLASVSAGELVLFTQNYLLDRTIQPDKDNLLLSFRNVTAVFANNKWQVNYCATPNSEIDQVFFTGVMLDPNIQA